MSPHAGDSIEVEQAYCSVPSDPSDPVRIPTCREIPAPTLFPARAGDTKVTLSNHQAELRIHVFSSSGQEMSDSSGPTVILRRALMAGESITVWRSFGECGPAWQTTLTVGP